MRHPVSFHVAFTVPWRKKQWLPRAWIDPRKELRYYPGQYYNQTAWCAEWLALRAVVVWSNDRVPSV